jgi:putative ATPase
MRPRSLGEFVGQSHLLAPGRTLANAVDAGELPSFILWGPPGCGKTTLARLLAHAVEADWSALSGVTSSVKDIRAQVEAARRGAGLFGRQFVLFVDEIHRFNKAQQDALLPHVERGTVTLIGATTENPGFQVNPALRSRARVLTLEPLSDEDVRGIVEAALSDPQRGLAAHGVRAEPEAVDLLVAAAHGDARSTLNALETAARSAWARTRRADPGAIGDVVLTADDASEALRGVSIRYDRSGDGHYRNTSAFIKSMRASDPDAALYYMRRMLAGGEDPRFILRRALIFASEDVGLADPQALVHTSAALAAFDVVGLPEGEIIMTQAVTYLALAPKSRAVYDATRRAQDVVSRAGHLPVPKHLINAVTEIDKELGHGKYAARPAGEGARRRCMPEGLDEPIFVPDE